MTTVKEDSTDAIAEDRVLYMDNLPSSMSEERFASIWAAYCPEKTIFRQHQTGTKTGYGFVTFPTPELATSAISKMGSMFLEGHQPRVQLAKKMEDLTSDK
eukprot:199814_1